MARMSTLCLATVLALALLAGTASAAARVVLQVPPLEGCSASPGSQTPPECAGALSGNQWDKDELECHVANYQLKCDHNQELVGTNTVRCNIDAGPLSSEIKFECPVDSNCQINCNWADVQGRLPGSVYPAVRRILTAWKPKEDIIG